MTGGTVAFLTMKVVVADIERHKPDPGDSAKMLASDAAYVQSTIERVGNMHKQLFLYQKSREAAMEKGAFTIDRNFWWDFHNITSRAELSSWMKRDRAQAVAEKRRNEMIQFRGVKLIPRNRMYYRTVHTWRYLRYSELADSARAELLEDKLIVEMNPGDRPFLVSAATRKWPMYKALVKPLASEDVDSLLREFCSCMAEPGARDLDKLYAELVTGEQIRRGRAMAVELLQSERRKWAQFSLLPTAPMESPERLTGGRWRIKPVFRVLAARSDSEAAEPVVTLAFTFDLAFMEDHWKIVGHWWEKREATKFDPHSIN